MAQKVTAPNPLTPPHFLTLQGQAIPLKQICFASFEDPLPVPPSFESQKRAIERFVGFRNWQSTGDVEEAKRRVVECVLKQRKILDLSGLGLSPFSSNMLKHLDFLGTFICDDANDSPGKLPDYFLEREWTILFIHESKR